MADDITFLWMFSLIMGVFAIYIWYIDYKNRKERSSQPILDDYLEEDPDEDRS